MKTDKPRKICFIGKAPLRKPTNRWAEKEKELVFNFKHSIDGKTHAIDTNLLKLFRECKKWRDEELEEIKKEIKKRINNIPLNNRDEIDIILKEVFERHKK